MKIAAMLAVRSSRRGGTSMQRTGIFDAHKNRLQLPGCPWMTLLKGGGIPSLNTATNRDMQLQ